VLTSLTGIFAENWKALVALFAGGVTFLTGYLVFALRKKKQEQKANLKDTRKQQKWDQDDKRSEDEKAIDDFSDKFGSS